MSSSDMALLIYAPVDAAEEDLDQAVRAERAAERGGGGRVDDVPNVVRVREAVVELAQECRRLRIVPDLHKLDPDLRGRVRRVDRA